VDVTRAREILARADVAARQAGAENGDLDADRVLAWLAGCAAPGYWPQDGLDLVVGRAVWWPARKLAFFQRGAVVQGVAQVGVGAVGEQPPDAGGLAVAGRGVQGEPSPLGVGLVDRGAGRNELVDDLQRRCWAANTSARSLLCRVYRPSGQPVTSPAAAAVSRLSIRAPAATRTSSTSVTPNTAA
jgi:hypothetical protein